MRSVMAGVLAAMIVTAGLATGAGAQMQKHRVFVAPAERNAALAYWRVFAQLKPDENKAISDIDWDACGESFDRAKMHATFAAAAALELDAARAGLIGASAMQKCNFECAWENGFGTTLPHLANMRAGARLLRFDARDAAIDGDTARAVEDLIAIRRMARHTALEPIAISKLVAIAIDSLACAEAESLAKSGLLTRELRGALVAEFESSDLGDLFAMSDFIFGERSMLAPKGVAPIDAATIRRLLKPMLEGEPKDAMQKIGAFSDAELVADCAKLRACYDLVEKEWKSADAIAGLGRVLGEVERGEHGELARVTAPAFTNIRTSYDKAVARVKSAIEVVKGAKTKD